MDRATFSNLPTAEVAQLVRETGPNICAFPINGTRRWFNLEHPADSVTDTPNNYIDTTIQRHIELYKLFFNHGIETLMTPVFGPDLLDRGESYVDMAVDGMARLGKDPRLLEFYESYGVRVRFYGDYHQYLEQTQGDLLADIFGETTRCTLSHNRYRLFFGVFAHDATQTVARIAVDLYQKRGVVPDKRALVESYYGEYVAPVDFFIGFDRFSAFDMPLVSTGQEDLYFTVAPSPYLTARQLRRILYDHIYVRPEDETDYSNLTPEDWSLMRDFYQANLERTQGVGARRHRGGFWYPLPQVEMPESWRDSS